MLIGKYKNLSRREIQFDAFEPGVYFFHGQRVEFFFFGRDVVVPAGVDYPDDLIRFIYVRELIDFFALEIFLRLYQAEMMHVVKKFVVRFGLPVPVRAGL